MFKRLLTGVLVLGSITVAFAQAPAFKRVMLQTMEISYAGHEAVTARAEFPVGVASGLHTHPGEEIGYLLEGSVTIEMDGQKKVLKPGDVFAIPAGKVHGATNTGTTPAAILSTYIVEKGKPLATPAK